jgi:hypothetical protein
MQADIRVVLATSLGAPSSLGAAASPGRRARLGGGTNRNLAGPARGGSGRPARIAKEFSAEISMTHGHGVGHGDGDGSNKYIAIFISALALLLAIAETMAKGAQTNSLAYNIEASNLWAFYQAKTIRQTAVRTAAEQLQLDVALARDPAVKKQLETRVAAWKADVARWQSEPGVGGGEGRKELQERAKAAEKKRDLYTEKYHHYEVSSALFQIGIVLASVFLITHVVYLLWAAGALTAAGVFFAIVGLFFPHAIHLF